MNNYTVDKEGEHHHIFVSIHLELWKVRSCSHLVYMDRIQRNVVTAVSTAELEERFNPEYIRTKGIGEDILPIAEESIIIKDSLMIHHLTVDVC